MDPFEPETFGELNADDYDERNDPGTTGESVALIREIAGNGRVLELAIGTGRMALPLAAAGVDISGLEASPLMVEKLRQKPGGRDIPVVVGDMADVDIDIDGQFDHIFLVFNTLFNLQSQEAQLSCFANVARRLSPGGTFLVEAFVPDFSNFQNDQRVGIRQMQRDSLWLDTVQHDQVGQMLEFQRVRMSESGMRLVPLRLRYVWPSEMDLMARLAGLRLAERWGSWEKAPFTASSKMHVSLYEKASD
ncbi:class I SAM-dependent methyltransferase [Rhodobacterales bacterium]|nr:class I SAM-dependent methyltransferase [Rhodobacterales bacterium]